MIWPEPKLEPLDRKVFIKHYDHLYLHGTLNPEILEYMDAWQLHAIRELHRSQNRMKRKQ